MELPKKLCLIVNPHAGRMRIQRELLGVVTAFSQAGWLVTVVPTMRCGTELTQQNARWADLVVCSGGDGTLNEVITGLMRLPAGQRPPLGYIPAGSTNDFATSLGLSSDLQEAAQAIIAGEERPLDVGAFNERYFSYIASFGAFTSSSYGTPQEMKNTFGHMAYILEGMKDISNIRPYHVRLTADTGESYEGDYVFGAVSNSTSIAGIVQLDKGIVDMSDGQLEVMLVKFPRDVAEFSRIVTSVQTRVYDPELIHFFHAGEVAVTPEPGMPWTLDGEYEAGAPQVRIRNCHHAIRLRA